MGALSILVGAGSSTWDGLTATGFKRVAFLTLATIGFLTLGVVVRVFAALRATETTPEWWYRLGASRKSRM